MVHVCLEGLLVTFDRSVHFAFLSCRYTLVVPVICISEYLFLLQQLQLLLYIFRLKIQSLLEVVGTIPARF